MSRGEPNGWKKKSKPPVRLLAVAALLVVLMISGLVWQRWFAPTRIVLVNYPDFQSTRITRASPDRFFHFDLLETDQISTISSADLVLIFGRGLKLDEAQLAHLRKLHSADTAIFVEAANNPVFDVGNLSESDRQAMAAYLKNGGQTNYSRMLSYARWAFDGQKWFASKPLPPSERPAEVFFYSDDDAVYTEFSAFKAWLTQQKKWKSGRPVLALLTSVPGPFKFDSNHVDAVIRAFEKKRFNVVPIAATAKRLAFLQQVSPAAVVYLPHGRLAPGLASQLQTWLIRQNIPLFAPLTIFDEREAWQDSQQSFQGGLLTMSVTLPELDGASVPMVIAAQEREANGLNIFRAMPDRLEQFAERVRRGISLKTMANRDKKLAIYYYKGPGQSALVAGDLEVVPSLFALLRHLRQQGYRVDGLPDTADEFAKLLQRHGSNIGPYAKGDFDRFMRHADPALVSVSQLQQWCGTTLLQSLCDQTSARFAAAPGKYLSVKDKVAVARMTFGNVVLLPQPLPGAGEDTFTLVHGAKAPPPWPYLASYLWTRNVFQADAIMHFGTHGSLEFTPYKQVGLSSTDWSDALIGPVPHTYLYTMSNVGEAMIAKRRSYATIVSHLTPPFQEGGAQAEYRNLAANLDAWKNADNEVLKAEYARDIQRDAIRLKLNEDLALPEKTRWELSQLKTLADHMETLVSTRVTAGLYTLGTRYTDERLESTVQLMTADLPESDLNQSGADTADSARASKGATGGDAVYTAPSDKVQSRSRSVDRVGKIQVYRQQILQSPTRELNSLTNHLAGGFVAPSSGGDMLRNPDALPTGRNLFSIDAEKTPSPQAWRTAGRLVTQMLEKQRAEQGGAWPRKVAFTLWAGDFIHTEGLAIAQILHLLGVEPVWDNAGRIMQLKLVPRDRLGRPRIDVLVQTSGQLRDLAASRLQLIQQAIALATSAEEPDNAVSAGVKNMQRKLKDQGLSPADATRYASQRVFGGVNGNYGSGIMHLVESGDHWQKDSEIARTYLNNMGAVYGDSKSWGEFAPGVLQAALADTDVVVQPLSSNTWGPLSLDHVYEFMGGLNLAVRHVTGKDPTGYFTDTRHTGRASMLGERAGIAIDARSTLLNPDYIRALTQGGASSAETFAETFRNTHAWNVMKPSIIGASLWNDLYGTYIQDSQQLGMREFFENQNSYALQVMTAVMLETARKGYWKPSDAAIRHIASVHAQLVAQYGASGTEFVNHNRALSRYISQNLESSLKEPYENALQQSNEGQAINTEKALVLTQQHEHNHTQQSSAAQAMESPAKSQVANDTGSAPKEGREMTSAWLRVVLVLAVLVAVIAAIVILWLRRQQRRSVRQ